MALIFMDGFDHWTTTNNLKWDARSGATISTTGGRRGGGACLMSSSSSYLQRTLPTPIGSIVCGAAFYVNSALPSSNTALFTLMDSTTAQCELRLTTTGALLISRNGTTVYTAPTPAIVANTWNYIEWKVTIGSTTGSSSVRINGSSTDYINISSVNLQATANSTATAFRLGTTTNLSDLYFDDFYLCDLTGTTNNNFLGDVRIDTLYPNADGTYSQSTPSTGTSRFALVDETSQANTTDYVDLPSVGNKDTYGMTNLPSLASSTIHAVQVTSYCSKGDAGTARSVANMIRSGTTELEGTSSVLTTSYLWYPSIFVTDPNTSGAWSQTAVNNLEVGVVSKA